jgi:hypothetical protein
MGLLDDAIREHLELKRRHGADPSEVARQEQEALGAPRRGEFAQPGEDAGDAPVAVAGETTVLEPAEPAPKAAEPAAPPEPAAPSEDPGPAGAYAAGTAPASAPDEPSPAEDAAAEAAASEEDPWLVEDEADERRVEPEAPAEEDVLEETPDFLQETPEHDRLWFEQKPPRDFDFDS